MSTFASSVRLKARLGAVFASVLLALLVPSIALAANTATFSSAYPKPGSISMAATPMLRVTAYDKYGVKGAANYTMTIDGVQVTPTITYIVVGSYNPANPDRRRFSLTYKVPSALSAGWHTIKVRLKDQKSKISTYSWKIGVDTSAAAATFSGLTPAIASSSQVAKPRLAVTVADRWDVKGSTSYTMKLDGTKVGASISYTTAGNYCNFTLAYQVTTTLTPAAHVVAVSVRDAAGRTTSASWTFTVLEPDPVFELMPAGGSCADCHQGFPAAHPMTNCVACHGPSSPPRPPLSLYGAGNPMEQYTAGGSQPSAHTQGCSTSATSHCHGGPFPHVLDSNCERCHNPVYRDVPQVHSLDAGVVAVSHESTSTFCTQTFCHATTLTQEHYRYTDRSGAKLDCVTCHGNTNPQIVSTIERGSAACADCHGTPEFRHPNTATAHAVTGDALTTCMGSGCHQTDLSGTHSGQCEFCHGSGASQVVRNAVAARDTRCATCHGIIAHSDLHILPSPRTDSCTGSGCHGGTNLTTLTINGATSVKHSTCTTCHGASAPTAARNAIAAHDKSCAACHGSGLPASHAGHATTVTAGVMSINGVDYGSHTCSECHSSDLQTIAQHASCSVCHPTPASSAQKRNFTCNQSACHGSGTLSGAAIVQHANISPAHDTTAGVTPRCGGAGCHGDVTDVAKIHNGLGRPDRGCGICHDGLTVPAPTKDCSSIACHPTYPTRPASHTSHIATVTADVMVINSHNYGSMTCTTCHGKGHPNIDLQRISQHTSCASCHPGPASGAAKNTFTCNQATCHGSGPRVGTAIAQHSAINASHNTTSGVATNCGGAGCHTDVSDVAVIHDALGRSDHGCGICHDGTVVATPTANCAAAPGCHPYYPGKPAAHTSHISTVTADVFVINGHDYGSFTCATCHGNSGTGNADIDLQKISQHTACTSCHPTPAGSAGKNDFTCNQADCHGSGTLHAGALVQHAAIAASHNTTSGVTTNCGGSGCHNDVSDVALIHDSVPGRSDHGCGICHDGTIVAAPTKNCASAAGCHPAYPIRPTSHTSHLSPVTGGTLTVNGITYGPFGCAFCHGNTGANNSAIDLQRISQHTSCTSCHPTPASTALKLDFTCDQAGCHAPSAPYYGTAHRQHYRISGIHNVPAAATNCGGSGCHTGGQDVAAIHAALPGRPDSGCGICHDGTLVSTPTTDCASAVGCHPYYPGKPPTHASHVATVTAGVITINGTPYGSHSCSECHGNTGAGNSQIDLQKITQHTNCASCHPTAAGLAHPGDFTCNQTNCHGTGTLYGAAVQQHTTVSTAHNASAGAMANCVTSSCHAYGTDVAAIHNHIPGVSGNGCYICHDGSIVATPTLNCSAVAGCHLNGPPASHGASAHTATVTTGTITLSGIAPAVHTCTECHTSLNLQTIHGGPTGCSNCHPAPADSTIGHNNWNGGCTQAGCHIVASGPMNAMHASADTSHTAGNADCAGTGCHNMNVAIIHETPTSAHPTPKSCAACHGRTTAPFAPTVDCLTVGCHSGGSGGGGTFPPGHPAPVALHTSTVVDCTQCHGTNVSTIHSTCARCHDTGKPTPVTTCPTCHSDGTFHSTAAAKHQSTADSECNGCHSQCQGCHSSCFQDLWTFSGDLPGIHSAQGYQCVVCHIKDGNGNAAIQSCWSGSGGCHRDMQGDWDWMN